MPTPPAMLLLPALNEMIDITTTRVHGDPQSSSARRIHDARGTCGRGRAPGRLRHFRQQAAHLAAYAGLRGHPVDDDLRHHRPRVPAPGPDSRGRGRPDSQWTCAPACAERRRSRRCPTDERRAKAPMLRGNGSPGHGMAVDRTSRPKGREPSRVLARAAALEAVMRQHNQRLYRLALSLVGNPDDAEDVLQDSYFHAFEKRASFAGPVGSRRLARKHRAKPGHRLPAGAPFPPVGVHARGGPAVYGQRSRSHPSKACRRRPRSGIRNSASNATKPAPRSRAQSCPCRLPFRAVFMLREVEGLSLQETATVSRHSRSRR